MGMERKLRGAMESVLVSMKSKKNFASKVGDILALAVSFGSRACHRLSSAGIVMASRLTSDRFLGTGEICHIGATISLCTKFSALDIVVFVVDRLSCFGYAYISCRIFVVRASHPRSNKASSIQF